MLYDYRLFYVFVFVIIQGFVWICSCIVGLVKCACGFGLELMWAITKGYIQQSLFNMDPRKIRLRSVADSKGQWGRVVGAAPPYWLRFFSLSKKPPFPV